MMLNYRNPSTVQDGRKAITRPDLIFGSGNIANICKKSIMVTKRIQPARGPLDVTRKSGASAGQMEETPGRASLEKLGCRTPPQLHAGGVGRQQQVNHGPYPTHPTPPDLC